MKNLKYLIIGLLISSGSLVQAQSDMFVTCSKDGQSVRIERLQGAVSYRHFAGNRLVGTGSLIATGEGFEQSLMEAYFWGFKSANGKVVIGLAVAGLRKPQAGAKYNALSDLIVVSGQYVMQGSTLPCRIEFAYDID